MKLYRFEKLEADRCETIINKKLWISSPKEFNDLHDCRLPAIYMPSFTEVYFDKLQSMINISYPENFDYSNSIFYRNLIEDLKNYIKQAKTPGLKADIRRSYYVSAIREKIINSVGICCFFSGEINEPLLWAHYADSHKGFCVEYEYDEEQDTSIHPVIYQTAPIIPSARELLLCPEESLTRLLTSKTMHWQYEKEYRLINLFSGDDKESGRLVDLPSCLKPLQIIKGAKLQDDEGLLKGIDIPINRFHQ
ncbi:DUF2971 domain-containing protein [Colwellia sp. 4_MG-2023]|uniref:DUF2971 domain-containing protein n=1 Tax=unclassified Colwellia TaxID=196834 RepID=UPI0026E3DBDF|nr:MULTISPECIES: DUF2971 domain-containing protein [unclassified Colwellia]MDO6506539.1 DUF2971 domain-containing protein [Colwellia sp. 5_MG-2023]MDO6555026.1 DUF2971 domain-containing protein [Colwellia sp. 4_MG-2023]